MTCTLELTDLQGQWFTARKDAWTIVNGGADDIRPTNSPHRNMVALLSNLADVGRRTWKYEPGNTTHVGNTRKGLHEVTDCGALADMFQQMAMNLGFTDARTWHIEPEDAKDRIVTGPDLMCFTGQVGDAGIEGRWCFGDHSVVRCGSKSDDPTFNRYFDTGPLPPYFGRWGRYVYDKTVFATHYFACADQPAIYNGFVAGTPSRAYRPPIKARAGSCGIGRGAARPAQPAVEATPGKMFYTCRKTDRAGKEIV